MTKSYLSIYLPQWPVNLLQRKLSEDVTDRGIVLTRRIGNVTRVARCCEGARRAGVKEGQEIALARALLPSAMVRELSPLMYYADLYELARWARRFTPSVGIDSTLREARRNGTLAEQSPLYTGLMLDMTGTRRLHKSAELVAERISMAMRKACIDCRVAWAPTIGAAWAFSRYGAGRITIVERSIDVEPLLMKLPCAALRLSEEALAWLQELGIERIDQLVALPRKTVSARFGPQVLVRLDAAFGVVEESIDTIPWPVSWLVKRSFDIPIFRREALERAVVNLLERLLPRLQSHMKKARVFTVVFDGRREDDATMFRAARDFSLYASTRSKRHLISIIGPILEALSLPGGVGTVYLCARSVRRSSAIQKSFLSDEEEDRIAAGELVNSFVTRLGRSRVRRAVFKASYVPERSYAFEPVETLEKHRERSKVLPELDLSFFDDRPSTLLAHPEEVLAVSMLPDKPPSRLHWKGRSYKVLRGIGPETICEEWWNGDIGVREYFKIQDQSGRWLWVYRDQSTQRWFVHGVWA